MKKKISNLLLLLILGFSFTFVGCSGGNGNVINPIEAIKQQYGTKEFTISFGSENLSEPVSDMVYTAYSMPKLPTPERVGYIFEGWYYDKAYSEKYTEGSLYLYMRNVTLYAKWTKEEFVNDGTYDIEIEAEIVDGSLKFGARAEEYGWKDFTKDIVLEETYIEKTETGLQLKLTYDNGITAPYGQTAAYQIVPSISMGSSVYLAESIIPDNEAVHSRFYNIDKFDITNPIYLDVTAINWNDGLSSSEALETQTSYTVKLTIKRLIGFSESYIDPDVPADPGYYLVKTHFVNENGKSSMMENYNSVYAYVQVDNDGNYTLIKPFTPYSGMVADVDNKTLSHYYSRDMTFAPTQLYYGITVPTENTEKVESDYYPDYYNASYYGNYVVEFHADTGKYYQIFDLGKSFKRQFMIKGATTGFMEQAFAFGAYNFIMSIDYEHIVKVSEIDYTPLSGENYTYGEEVAYYTGQLSDLNSQNLTKSTLNKYGVANEMVNLFYSATNINAATSSRTMHSFRMTVSPTATTNATEVKDARNKIAVFNVNYNVYGYNPHDGSNLYADSMTATYLGSDGIARRENVSVLNGKSLQNGDKIWLTELYKEKVNAKVDYVGKNVTVYALNASGKPDFDSGITVDVNAQYTFTKNVAIEYKNGESVALVYLKQYSDPTIEIVNTDANTYTKYGHTVSDRILFPIVRYTFMGNSGGFIDEYYPSTEHDMVADPTRIAIYEVNGENYSLTYLSGTLEFEMRTNHVVVAYECRNEFGEIYTYYLDFYAESQTKYSMTENGEEISSGTVRYNKDSDERQAIGYSDKNANKINSFSELTQIENKVYRITFGNTEIPLNVSNCCLYANGQYQEFSSNIFANLKAAVRNSDYYVFVLTYSNGSDYCKLTYEYGLMFDGKKNFAFVADEDTFTGYEYTLKCPKVITSDGTVLASGTLEIKKYSNGSYYNATGSVNLTQYGDSYEVMFKSTGKYKIIFTVALAYDEEGNRLFGGEFVTVTFEQYIDVIDGKGDVSITYVTDKDHPFAEGIPYTEITDELGNVIGYAYKVTYNLTDSILTMAQQNGAELNFAFEGKDRLFGWFKSDEYSLIDASTALRRGTLISDYIGTFGKKDITLYALWDKGLSVNIDRAESITGLKSTTLTKWLSAETNYYGSYSFGIKELSFDAPTGYIHKGWLINGKFYSADSLTTFRYNNDETINVEVVLAKEYVVRYIIDSDYADRVADSTVEEGYGIKLPDVTVKEGYTFKEWRLVTWYMSNSDYTVGNNTIDDTISIGDSQALCQVNGKQAVVLVAVFEDSEGNEVW